MKRPTIKDVARQSGFSLSTVSLVINQRGYVSDETRDKIMKVVDELHYHPTHSARGLASKTSGNIGFILSEDHFSKAEPFYTRIFLGTEFEARNHNFYILLTTVGNQFTPEQTPRFLLERNVDGIIIAGKVDPYVIDHIDSFGIPLILVDYEFRRKRFSSVLIDNYGGACAAMRHLVQLGHRAIGFIGADMGHPSMSQRYHGYQDVLQEIGMEGAAMSEVEEQEPCTAAGFAATERLMSKEPHPTAIFAANDAMAIGCLQYARQAGISVPRDLSIIGFDDIESCAVTEPRLSTVRVMKEEMGKLAVQRLVETISSKTQNLVTTHVPVELVVRESTALCITPAPNALPHTDVPALPEFGGKSTI